MIAQIQITRKCQQDHYVSNSLTRIIIRRENPQRLPEQGEPRFLSPTTKASYRWTQKNQTHVDQLLSTQVPCDGTPDKSDLGRVGLAWAHSRVEQQSWRQAGQQECKQLVISHA